MRAAKYTTVEILRLAMYRASRNRFWTSSTDGNMGTPGEVMDRPDRAPAHSSASRQADGCGTITPMKILLVDDEPTVRDIVAELLELDGHIVARAENAPGALALLAADKSFDLILADVGMPHMNGWALAREVKGRYPDIRVGLVTGYGETGPSDPQDRSVVDFILAKPISEEVLRTVAPAGA